MTESPVSVGNRFDRESIDTLVLGGAFLIGITASLLLKILDFAVWLPAATSAVIIVLYAVVTFYSLNARLEPDQIGDNAYYLGFVLTLTSLAYTLWELGQHTTNPDLINDVIAGFGIALSSTIVGVVVRVILLQYRVDLVARDREARLQLNEAMQQFHLQIENLVRGMKYLGTEMVQTLEEHHKLVAQSYEQRTETLVAGLVGTFKASLDQVLDQSKEVNQRLSQSARRTMEVGQKASLDVLNSIATHSQTLLEAYKDGLSESSTAFKDTLLDMTQSLGGIMDKLRSETLRTMSAAASAHEQNINGQVALMKQSTLVMQQSADNFATQLQTTLRQAEASMQAIATVSAQSLVETKRTMAGLATMLREEGVEIKHQADNLGQLVGQLDEQAQATLAEVSDRLKTTSEELNLQVAALKNNVGQFELETNETMAAVSTRLQQTSAELISQINDLKHRVHFPEVKTKGPKHRLITFPRQEEGEPTGPADPAASPDHPTASATDVDFSPDPVPSGRGPLRTLARFFRKFRLFNRG